MKDSSYLTCLCHHAVMSLTAGACSLATEQLWYTLPKSAYFASPSHILVTSLIILFGGAIAFLMVWTEFTVIAETSALTFMVAGTFKEIVTGECDLLLWHVPQEICCLSHALPC